MPSGRFWIHNNCVKAPHSSRAVHWGGVGGGDPSELLPGHRNRRRDLTSSS